MASDHAAAWDVVVFRSTVASVWVLCHLCHADTFTSGNGIQNGRGDTPAQVLWTQNPLDSHDDSRTVPNYTTEGTESPTEAGEGQTPSWQTAIERTQMAMAIFGFAANIITLVTLTRNGDTLSPPICLLLKHQALADSGVCAMAAVILVQVPFWTSDLTWLDVLTCHIWHSQALYWFMIFVSIWNLVFVSAERYMAICLPFLHSNLTTKRMVLAILLLYLVSLLVITPDFLRYRFDYDRKRCRRGFIFSGEQSSTFYYAYTIVCLFTDYFIPLMAYIAMYSRILFTLATRKKNVHLATSRTIRSTSNCLTKTAVALTLIFIFSIGFGKWYYVLGNTGVIPHKPNSPVHEIPVFLAVFNSCINPCVYTILMPAYRKSLRRTFWCHSTENVLYV